jgi:DNA repair protein RadC
MKYQIVSERTSRYSCKISHASDGYRTLTRYLRKTNEHLLVLTLDGQHSVIRVIIVSIGIANRTLVHPREVFIPAIKDNACGVILAHNHPSGNIEPSQEDQEITTRLCKAGEILDISVLDHVIITKNGYYSFLEEGNLSLINHNK